MELTHTHCSYITGISLIAYYSGKSESYGQLGLEGKRFTAAKYRASDLPDLHFEPEEEQ